MIKTPRGRLFMGLGDSLLIRRIAKTNDILKHQSKHDRKVPKRLSAILHTLTCGKTMKGFQEECIRGLILVNFFTNYNSSPIFSDA